METIALSSTIFHLFVTAKTNLELHLFTKKKNTKKKHHSLSPHISSDVTTCVALTSKQHYVNTQIPRAVGVRKRWWQMCVEVFKCNRWVVADITAATFNTKHIDSAALRTFWFFLRAYDNIEMAESCRTVDYVPIAAFAKHKTCVWHDTTYT